MLGKGYFCFKVLSIFIDFCSRFLNRSISILKSFSFRTAKFVILLVIVYSITPKSLGAPESQIITTRSQWEAGTLIKISRG